MDMPRFSVIVPVYNVEDYLEQCVQSVVSQTFRDWELVLVDDGSPDKCPKMCDEFAALDCRIKVVHKQNGGQSSARNAGLDACSGEYVLFLDSDDFYNSDKALEVFDKAIRENDAQVLIFGCTDFNMNTGKTIVSRTGYDLELIAENDTQKTLHYLLSSKMIPGGPTIFCFARHIVTDNGISFKTGIQDEDYDFVLSVFTSCKSISAVNDPFYSYRQGRANSITGSSSIKMIYGIEYTVNKWLKETEKIGSEMIRKDVLNYLAFIYSTGYVVCGRMDRKTRKEALRIMKGLKSVFKYAYWRKTRIASLGVRLLGGELFSIAAAKYFALTHI